MAEFPAPCVSAQYSHESWYPLEGEINGISLHGVVVVTLPWPPQLYILVQIVRAQRLRLHDVPKLVQQPTSIDCAIEVKAPREDNQIGGERRCIACAA